MPIEQFKTLPQVIIINSFVDFSQLSNKAIVDATGISQTTNEIQIRRIGNTLLQSSEPITVKKFAVNKSMVIEGEIIPAHLPEHLNPAVYDVKCPDNNIYQNTRKKNTQQPTKHQKIKKLK